MTAPELEVLIQQNPAGKFPGGAALQPVPQDMRHQLGGDVPDPRLDPRVEVAPLGSQSGLSSWHRYRRVRLNQDPNLAGPGYTGTQSTRRVHRARSQVTQR